jgi:hypothetical protein
MYDAVQETDMATTLLKLYFAYALFPSCGQAARTGAGTQSTRMKFVLQGAVDVFEHNSDVRAVSC